MHGCFYFLCTGAWDRQEWVCDSGMHGLIPTDLDFCGLAAGLLFSLSLYCFLPLDFLCLRVWYFCGVDVLYTIRWLLENDSRCPVGKPFLFLVHKIGRQRQITFGQRVLA
ncbi:hypothetical protein BJX66DRAFT_298785 [Aspergillus keveii]|uniref:Uncharacterized protein n=1 Tax=Aspergillus keveii TaxID=714993 RepID=A0ABR4GCV9_9EURO